MLDVSSHGRAAPRTKTINVEANLLAERLAERERVRRLNLQKIALVTATLVLGVGLLPQLRNWSLYEAKAFKAIDAQHAVLSAHLADLNKQQDDAKPKISDEKLKADLARETDYFLGGVVALLNSPPPNVVFDGLKVSLTSGNIEMNGRGNAATYDDYIRFANDPATGIEIHGYRESAELGPNGIAFDFTKKLAVPQ